MFQAQFAALICTEPAGEPTLKYRNQRAGNANPPGLIVQFNQNPSGIKRGERFTVVKRSADTVTVARNDNSRIELPLEKAERFSVYRQDKQALAVGDRIRATKNGLSEPEMRNGRAIRREIVTATYTRFRGF